MADKRQPIKPKSESFEEGGQRYTCTYDPNAPKENRWVWEVHYTIVFRYFGSKPTMEAAASTARRKIHALNRMDHT